MKVFDLASIEKMKTKHDLKGLRTILDLSSDPAMLVAATQALGEIGDASVTHSLIRVFQSCEEPNVRAAAAMALGKIGQESEVLPLLQAREKGQPPVVEEATLNALVAMAKRGIVNPFLAALESTDPDIQFGAAEVLVSIGDKRATGPLIASLGRSQRWSRAEELLTSMGDLATDSLLLACKDNNPMVRSAIWTILSKSNDSQLVEPFLEELKDEDGPNHIAAEWLARIGERRAIEPIAAKLQNGTLDIATGTEALRKFGALAVKSLASLINDGPGGYTRRAAFKALSHIDDLDAVPLLIAALNDQDDVGKAAASALGRIGGSTAIEALIHALKSGHPSWRRIAAEALGIIGAPAVDRLIADLNDSDWVTRRHIAMALGIIGDEKAIGPLLDLLKESIQFDGEATRTKPVTRVWGLTEGTWFSGEVEIALRKIGRPAVGPLIALLRDGNWYMQEFVVMVLAQIGEPAIEFIELGLKDEDWVVRFRLVEALGRIGTSEAKEAVKELKEDPNAEVRHAVSRVLEQLSPEDKALMA